jgi:hypothetical protein
MDPAMGAGNQPITSPTLSSYTVIYHHDFSGFIDDQTFKIAVEAIEERSHAYSGMF